jgi:hypothetical protein
LALLVSFTCDDSFLDSASGSPSLLVHEILLSTSCVIEPAQFLSLIFHSVHWPLWKSDGYARNDTEKGIGAEPSRLGTELKGGRNSMGPFRSVL